MPKLAMIASDRPASAGKTGSDAALLIALSFLAIYAREVVIAVWLVGSAGVGVGLNALAVTLSSAIAMDLVFLLSGAVAVMVFAGRRRSLGRDFDLACIAFVPYLVVKVTATLALQLGAVDPGVAIRTGVGIIAYGWGGGLLILAIWQARNRRDRAPTEAAA